MLSLQISNDGKGAYLYCDQAGMALLLEKLASLTAKPDQVHLWGGSLDGTDLTELTPFGETALSELIISYSPNYTQKS